MPRYKVNGNTYNLPEEKVEAFLAKFPEAVLFEEEQEVGKQVDVAVEDAAVTSVPEPASESMELESVDTSLVSQPERRSVRGQQRAKELERIAAIKPDEIEVDEEIKLSAEPKFDEFDAVEELKTSGSLFKANLKRVGANLAEIPAFVNRLKFSVGKAFLSDEDKEKINKLTPEEQDQVAQAFGGVSVPGTINIGALAEPGQKAAANLRSQAEKLEENLKVYDNTITDTIFKEGDVTEGVTRLVTQGIGTIPSIMQAMIPYVGIPSIVAGSAAEASREAVYEKEKDIDLKQQLYSAGIGASEGLLEIVTKKIGKSAFKGLIGKPKEVVKKTLLQTGTGIAKAGGAEGLSETGTLAINKFLESKYFNEKGLFDMDEQKWDEFWDEAGDTFLIGMTTGKGMAGTGATAVGVRDAIGNRSVRKELNKTNINEVSEAFTDDSVDDNVVNLARNNFSERVLDIELNKKVNLGNLTKEKANEIKDNFNSARAAVTLADNLNINDALVNETVSLVQERNKVSKKIKQAGENKALVDTDVKRLAEIDNRLSEISAENQLSITTKAVTDIVSGLEGLTIEIAENQEQADQIAEDKNLEKKASIQQGFILQNPETGEQTIVINKEIAKKEKAVNVAAHELLHGVLFKTVKDSPETAVNLGKSLLEEINKIDASKVKDSNFKKRLELYSADPESVKMEEALTLFSDAVATGDLAFDENIFTKIGDQIRRIMQSLGVNIKFNTGRDVYNFVKDYNKNIQKGALTKAQVKAAKEGVKGRLVKDEVKQAETIIKESRSEEASQEVQRIYEEQGEAGAFDIIEQFKPITNKIVDRRRDAPGFNREDLTSEIELGKRGILDLIREYDPESGVPLAAYINKFLPARAIEASNRILGEQFTEDVTEARGVMAEEVTTEVKEEARGPKKPTETTKFNRVVLENLGVENKQQAEKQISDATKEAFEGQEVKRFGQTKNVPKSVAEIYGKMFGVNPETIYDKKRNYSKKDAEGLTRIKQYLIDNAASDYARLPKTKDDFGKATFIPNNVMNALYTDGKLTGTLKDYMDLVREKPVKPIYRDRVGQTIRGLFNTSIRNRMVEDLIPVKAERARAGVKFSKADEKEINEFIEKQGFVKTEDELAAENKVWKFISKKLGIDFISSKDPKDVEAMKTWLAEKLGPKMPKSFMTQGTLANAGTSAAKRNFFLTSKQAIDDLFEGVEFAKEDADIAEAVTRKTYVTGGAEGKISTKFLKEFNSKEFKEAQARKLKGLKKIFKTFETMIQEDPNNTKFIIALLSSTSQGMGHFVRTSAPIKFYSKNLEGGIVEEHTMPASLVAKYMFNSAVNGTVDADFKNIENNYFQGALGKNDDKKLKGKKPDGKPFNYTSMTPEGWKITDNIWARYFNLNVATNDFGIDPNNIVLSDGKTVFEKFGVNSAGHKVSESINETTQKAAKGNNNKLPDVVKVKLSKSNPVVLSEMSKLDEEAAEARKQAKFSKAVELDRGFNNIIEAKTGIASEKEYKKVKAEVAGAGKGRFNFFIPPSAEDFVGLLYDTLSKGKLGDAQMAWYKKHLLNPYGRAMNELSSARIALMNDYKQLKKQLDLVPKNLRKKVPGEPFTREQAVRVYIWNKQGMEVPGISEADLKDLTEYVQGNSDLQMFADQLIAMQKGDQYAKPKEGWPAGTITTDLLEGLNTTKRAKYLEQWQENVDVIFSEKNLNKLEAAYGKGYRKALENMLSRMKSGRNRSFAGDSLTGRVTDWLTGSIGTIMFFNTRSALLQTISSINFVNFTDNNILAAGKAFANQKQFWSDFVTLINSDFLKERRGGLRINVNEADIADMAKKGGVRGVINKLLEFGFAPTQIADSFAIASGGATFYRNRIKTLKKQGLSDADAEAQAFVDFREIAEESQQSSRPDRISMQQAGPLGRIILAFANTPAQYARLIKKAASDLKNNRGDAKTNISKIIYYGVAQNLLFNALQQALFAFGFGDEEPEDEEKQEKYISIANGMLDSLLRGMGIAGAVLSVGKNSLKRVYDEMQKKQPKLEKVGYELTKISPPISAKLSRINQAARSYQWDKKEMQEKGFSLDNPAYLAGANVVSALTNIPVDRAIKKTNNVVQATSQDLETWERLALLGGWQDWEIGLNEETKTNKPPARKTVKKKIIKKKVIK